VPGVVSAAFDRQRTEFRLYIAERTYWERCPKYRRIKTLLHQNRQRARNSNEQYHNEEDRPEEPMDAD
jgi:hypothetical protein